MFRTVVTTIIMLFLAHSFPGSPRACSTFKFQKGGELIYAHNLDQPDRDMPGMIFINKRGVFRTGRSYSEMFLDRSRREPSDLSWISRYGSITFSIYGRDFPDGGINEAGIFIWEMSLVGSQFPEDEKLPRLLKTNWMQYVLDNSGTLDEALSCAYEVQIEGWNWHFLVGDDQGNCATLEFIGGEVVIHRNEDLPVPALFNQPYDREVEYLQLFKGFGGLYEPDFEARLDTRVPRFVKAAVMLRDYNPAVHDPLEYSKSLLYEVGNKPYKWGILVDVVRKRIHFNTESNPEWKSFSYRDTDFSNSSPVLTLNIDQQIGGDVLDRFHPLQDDEYKSVLKGYVDDLPEVSIEYYGVPRDTLIDRFATAYHEAERKDRHYFSGIWRGASREADENGEKEQMTLTLNVDGSNVSGSVDFRGEVCELQHIRLKDRALEFSFRTETGYVMFPKGYINGESLDLQVRWIKGLVDSFLLHRQ